MLILTYNLTLCMYIRDKINEVREDFPWAKFEIINYHKFMMFALNSAGINIEFEKETENVNKNSKKNTSGIPSFSLIYILTTNMTPYSLTKFRTTSRNG